MAETFRVKLKQTWSSPEGGGKGGDVLELSEQTCRNLVGCGAADWDGDEPGPMPTDSATDGSRNRRSAKGQKSKAADGAQDDGTAGTDASGKPTAPPEDAPAGKAKKGKDGE